ncbi:substrate-binding periplasmic protein [Lacimicrobium alkaliphilum]|uniref:substrate-binding periplasmic protein n=1 Tax=Lacimicrobium alkaliphilum TaxID=1526571 RepID=UPI001666C4E1|nr:transporter substrate-binding domain-containing protein [Lacimicrobium alkaliphilum]
MCWCCLLSPPVLANALCPEPLTLVYTGDWRPYIYRENDSRYSGQDKTLLAEVLEQMNCELSVLPLPERRVEKDLLTGRIDVVIAASKNTQRLRQFWFSVPYRIQHNVLVYRQDQPLPANPSLLRAWITKSRIIALNGGGWFGHEVERLKNSEYGQRILHLESLESRLEMLRLGRIDGFIDDLLAVQDYIKAENLTDLKIVEQPIHVTPQHFMFSKASLDSEFIQAFNQILIEMTD